MFYDIFITFVFKLNSFVMDDLNQIKVVLVKKKKTGKWLAEQLNKSSCTVSKWCSNSAQPDLHTLEQIAQILGVDKRELLTPSELR